MFEVTWYLNVLYTRREAKVCLLLILLNILLHGRHCLASASDTAKYHSSF